MSQAADVIAFLDKYGPATGKMLLEKTRIDQFRLWQICHSTEQIVTRTVGRKYLRLDRQVEGYARLSMSIVREFFGYTVIGTEKNRPEILARAELLQQEIEQISRRKFALAREVMTKTVASLPDAALVQKNACFIIAGDVVYQMAHTEPRPEISTGELVQGSDLDIVVVYRDLPERVVKDLDLALYQQKNFLLKNPSYQEEIDYIIKDIPRVIDQLRFDCFESMVATKILQEGEFLCGNRDIFTQVKEMLCAAGIPERIAALEEKALIERGNARTYLLQRQGDLSEEEAFKLFYTREEKEEFF